MIENQKIVRPSFYCKIKSLKQILISKKKELSIFKNVLIKSKLNDFTLRGESVEKCSRTVSLLHKYEKDITLPDVYKIPTPKKISISLNKKRFITEFNEAYDTKPLHNSQKRSRANTMINDIFVKTEPINYITKNIQSVKNSKISKV